MVDHFMPACRPDTRAGPVPLSFDDNAAVSGFGFGPRALIPVDRELELTRQRIGKVQ